jgi:hypothetical protein
VPPEVSFPAGLEGKKTAKLPKNRVRIFKFTSVMAVTDPNFDLRETSFVNKVQGASTKALLEPGDTRQQWKGEAATISFK